MKSGGLQSIRRSIKGKEKNDKSQKDRRTERYRQQTATHP
jgi:hypothetical protein